MLRVHNVDKVITVADGRQLQYNKGRFILFFSVMLILLFAVYRECVFELAKCVLRREGSSHGLFIPFIAAFFFWKRREAIANTNSEFAPFTGGLLICLGLFLLYRAGNDSEITFTAISFFVTTAGVIIFLFGREVFKSVAVPFFFLMTMIPLPRLLYYNLAELMRYITTEGATCLSQMFGVPLVRKGYHIDLPNVKLFVGLSCSGIRYLLSYFVFGLAYAFYFKNTPLSRFIVVAATIPLSVVAGIIRLTVIFISAYYIGAFMAGHYEHVFLSWLVFVVILSGVVLMEQGMSTHDKRVSNNH